MSKIYLQCRCTQVEILAISNRYYSRADCSEITCDLQIKGLLVLTPFTADKLDSQAFGRELYADLHAGLWGELTSYEASHPDKMETEL